VLKLVLERKLQIETRAEWNIDLIEIFASFYLPMKYLKEIFRWVIAELSHRPFLKVIKELTVIKPERI